MGKWILAFLIAAAVLLLCWKLRGVMLTPVRRGKGQSLELVLRVSGASPEQASHRPPRTLKENRPGP